MAFIGFEELVRFLAGHGVISVGETTLYYLYPVKIVIVAGLLYRYRGEYRELRAGDLTMARSTLAVCVVGLLVYSLWIELQWTVDIAGTAKGFNPMLLPGKGARIALASCRIIGSVLVVPPMEELFWRSFLIRTIIDSDFRKIPIGTFTWPSFLLTVVLFGLEHHAILAGIMAGIAYNLVLYKTRSIAQCILAHSLTNLALAVHVISTGSWHYW